MSRRASGQQWGPGVPAQGISAASARRILELVEGPEVPDDWTGGVAAPYTLGGSWRPDADIANITVTVNNVLVRQELKNVHATRVAADESRCVLDSF